MSDHATHPSADAVTAQDGHYAVGVDVGGTSAKLGLVGPDGDIVLRESFPTGVASDPRDICQRVAQFVEASGRSLATRPDIGVAVPGILDATHGLLREVSNLPGWKDFPLRDELAQLLGQSVTVVNDANAAAFAEHSSRSLGDESLALVTLGTGIGCGVVLAGRPFGGDHGCGGEVGHAVINPTADARQCGCGRRGHLEAYAGAAGVVATAHEELRQCSDERVQQRLLNAPLTPERIAAEAEAGDSVCSRVVERTAEALGVGVSILCQTLNPSVVLLGGAMTFGGRETATGRRFLACVSETVCRNTLDQIGQRLEIDFATLGADAGLLGAAELARVAAGKRDGMSAQDEHPSFTERKI